MTEKLLKSIGISAKIATGFIVLGAFATLYRNYYELRKTKMQIKLLKKELEEKKLA